MTPRSTRPTPASRRRWRCSPRCSAAPPTTAGARRSSRPCTTSATTTTPSGTAASSLATATSGSSTASRSRSRSRARVRARGHPVHRGLAYQGEVRCAERVHVGRLRRLRQAAAARADRRGGRRLIGEGLFLPGVAARGLRSMAAPGSAYEDPVIGKDPQVGHGVVRRHHRGQRRGAPQLRHPQPCLPPRRDPARQYSWERAGRLWFDALTSSAVGPDTGFAEFARATVAAAGDDRGLRDVVGRAWVEVGVLEPAAAGGAAGALLVPGPRWQSVLQAARPVRSSSR